jgi:hypothetical protein
MSSEARELDPSHASALRAALRAGHAQHYRLDAAEEAHGLTAEQGRPPTTWRAERDCLRRELPRAVSGQAAASMRDAER